MMSDIMENDWEELLIESHTKGITIQLGRRKGSLNHIDITSKSVGIGHHSTISHYLKDDDINKLIEFLQGSINIV
jgi:hypothetical protein